MSSVKELVLALKEQAEINQKVSDLKADVCNGYCPYKIGDIVQVKGWSHQGKNGRVTKVFLTADWREKIDFKIVAEVLRKDGSVSNFKADWDSHNDENLKAALEQINNHKN